MAGAAAAAPHVGHAAFHEKKDFLSDLSNIVSGNLGEELNTLLSDAVKVMGGIGAMTAKNSQTPTDTTWIGAATQGNAVVHTIANEGASDVVFSCWGADASWVNVHEPEVAVTIPAGKNVTLSHAVAQGGAQNTGGCGTIYPDTKLVNGQIFETWLEYTFLNDQYGGSTFDISKEVNMLGNNMTTSVDGCVSDFDHCSFHCNDASVASCGEAGSYFLKNCEAGSQKHASSGKWGGQASGGCEGIAPTGITKMTTVLH